MLLRPALAMRALGRPSRPVMETAKALLHPFPAREKDVAACNKTKDSALSYLADIQGLHSPPAKASLGWEAGLVEKLVTK